MFTKENLLVGGTAVVNFVRTKVLSTKGIAIVVCLCALYFGYNLLENRVIPMSYGTNGSEAVGAQTQDLVGLGLSALTAIVSFLVSRFTGVQVQPEVIAAVLAFEKDPKNEETQRRLGAAILGYMMAVLKQHPEGSGAFVLQLLTMLVNTVPDPSLKNVLSAAATQVATNQFKQVPEVVAETPVAA